MKTRTLEEIIRQYILSTNTSTKHNWIRVLCKICSDHGKKGKRAGFHFENDKVVYHCFNCGYATAYDPTQHNRIPKKMLDLLKAFNILEEEYKQVVFSTFGKTLNVPIRQKPSLVEPPTLILPQNFCLLRESNSKWSEVAKAYLEHEREIDYTTYPFMICSQTEWAKRIIIPIYKNNNLIYYQGRDITFSTERQNYLSPPIEKNKILYGFDRLFENNAPLFITEGFFDAFLIDGVALLGKEISAFQQAWLESSSREKIYIPDKTGEAKKGAQQALSFGWYISTPDIGNCKDINDACSKYGKLYVIKSIMDNKAKGLKAKVNLKQYCKG
ncbi:MAG: hypothetical protein ACREAU_02215 [Nitrosopumilaceae archaeon]